MSAHPPRRAPQSARQRGQAMLLTVLLLGVGVSAVVYNFVAPAKQSIERDRITAAALAQAKEALIGYAASDSNRPGSLPCPDLLTDNPGFNNIPNDGSADQFFGQECPSYVGRLPWRTLGLPDLRDGSGERLWYAVSRDFARSPACGAACPLNSETLGALSIDGTAPASQVVAIVFSAGVVVGAQNRSSTATSSCGALGTIVNDRCPANYLDGENSNGLPPIDNIFFTAPASASFNDQLLPITNDQVFQVVNMRVVRDLRAAVVSYRTATGYYPRANAYGDDSYDCGNSTYTGRLPLNPMTCSNVVIIGSPAHQGWGTHMPSWFVVNLWNTVTHYSVTQVCSFTITTGVILTDAAIAAALQPFCDNAVPIVSPIVIAVLDGLGLVITDLKTIDIGGSVVTASVVLFVSGRATAGQPTPCTPANPCRLEAPNTITGNAYTKPSRYPVSNDRMAAICMTTTPCSAVP